MSFLGLGGGGQTSLNIPDWLRPYTTGYDFLGNPNPFFSGGQNSQVPTDVRNFVGPSGYGGLMPNLAFLYGSGPGTPFNNPDGRPASGMGLPLDPYVATGSMNQLLGTAFGGALVPGVNYVGPINQNTSQGLNFLLQGGGAGAGQAPGDQLFTDFQDPNSFAGPQAVNPLMGAGISYLQGGQSLPSFLDPATNAARMQTLSGQVPANTYSPLLDELDRRGSERLADLNRDFADEIMPGLVQRLAGTNYGSAGERIAADLTERWGEQARRIADDTQGGMDEIMARAGQDALQRQFGMVGQGMNAALGLGNLGAGALQGAGGLELGHLNSAYDRSLRAAQIQSGNYLDSIRGGIGMAGPAMQGMFNPFLQMASLGGIQRDIEKERLAELFRLDWNNLHWANLNRYAGLMGAVPPYSPIGQTGGSSSWLGPALTAAGTALGGGSLGQLFGGGGAAAGGGAGGGMLA